MSTVVVVYNARQLKVKVTPGTLLKEVKERACGVLELNPELYSLRHKTKLLNESLPFRFSNLVSNAKLDLVFGGKKKNRGNVRIKVQAADLPPEYSDKLVGEFGPATTVYAILRHFEKLSGINFTQRVHQGNLHEFPTVVAFNAQLNTFEQLDQSLEKLGLTGGSEVLRVRFEKKRDTIESALKAQELLSTEVTRLEAVPDKKIEEEKKTEKTSDIDTPTESTEQKEYNNDRKAQVYLPTETQRIIPDDYDDDGSYMSTDQFKLYRSQLAHSSGSDRRDAPLMTKAMREQLSKDKKFLISSCIIRVRMPDQTHVEGVFSPGEPVGALHQFVKSVLKQPDLPFKLFVTPPRRYLADPEELLRRDLKFGSREVVLFEWDGDQGPKSGILKDELVSEAKSIVESESIKTDEAQPTLRELAAASAASRTTTTSNGGGLKKGGVPKWLKLSKK